MLTFEYWLGQILGQDEVAIKRLIKDPTGLHFLMAWSLFESKCCAGEFKAAKHCASGEMPGTTHEENAALLEEARYFHTRYQSEHNRVALAPSEVTNKKALAEFITLLAVSIDALSVDHARTLDLFVAARIRNNMFHGQKGIDDWLRDKDLIRRCTKVLQTFVSAQERVKPTLALKA